VRSPDNSKKIKKIEKNNKIIKIIKQVYKQGARKDVLYSRG
jgi:hypothetical protein